MQGIIPKNAARITSQNPNTGDTIHHIIGVSTLWGRATTQGSRFKQVTYYPYDTAEGRDERDPHIRAGLLGQSFDNWYKYALVRLGFAPRCKYYPLPKLLDEVKAGTRDIQKQQILCDVCDEYGVSVYDVIPKEYLPTWLR